MPISKRLSKFLPSALSRGRAKQIETLKTQEAGAGSLNPRQQLEDSYAALLSNAGTDEAWRKEFFQKVRIVVLGRSGVGKTTLIRLLVGKHGPQTISEGVAGVQNINDEFIFSSEDQGVPLVIHDTNGMDVRGEERTTEIKNFLDKHQKSSNDFTERIHIVWYVISAIDSRCIDDGGVMQMVRDYKIPLLLIMTHGDYSNAKVNDTILDKLLRSAYPVDGDREFMKKMMVRVKNDGVCMGANNELIIDESKRDTKGLKLVAQRTQQLMDKKLRYTWIAAQAVDVDGKLEESAGIIAGFSRRALLTSLPRAIPFADPLKLAIIFHRMLVIMCQIWVVPPELQKALDETLLQKDGNTNVLRRFGVDMVYATGLAATVAATVLTGGTALPAVIVVLASSGVLSIAKSVPILVKTFALQVLGTILYVRSAQETSTKHRWKPGVSREEYTTLCNEFAYNADHRRLIVDFAKKDHSILDTALHKNKVKGMVKSKVVEMYRRLLLHRPNSLFSLLKDTEAADEQNIVDEIDNEVTSTLDEDSEDELDDFTN